MDEAFGITDEVIGGVPVIRVAGEIDVATAPALRERIGDREGDGASVLVVDLLQVSFLDSTALGVLVGALKRFRERDGSFRVAVAEPRILKVFEITDLDQILQLYPTVEAAVAG